MIELGPATFTPTGGAYNKGVWRGLPFAPNDAIERYVTSEFGAYEQFRKDLGWSPHRGIDLHAAIGTPLHALGPGDIEVAGPSGFYPVAGTYVQIHHGDGLRTMYLHMSEIAPGLKVGSKVERGQYIGKSGDSSSVSIAPHLHLSVNVDEVGSPLSGARIWKDPVDYIVAEVEAPLRERLQPVEAIVMAVDGTVPEWDRQLSVRYTVERDKDGNERHIFELDKADRLRVAELAKTAKF